MKYLFYIILLVSLVSCAKQFPHAKKERSTMERNARTICPTGRYSSLSKSSEKNLGRKKYKFKKALPSFEKRETLMDGDFDNGDN